MSGAARPSLAPFFHPASVAVIGASRDPAKVGGSVLANLRAAGFAGRVVPVNARADTVQGLPAAASILAVDEPVDLAVIAVPAPQVLPALKECVAKGVAGAVVISAGFRESGAEGQRREAELRAWLRDQPLRVLGPNCLGWIRPAQRLNVTFAPGMPSPGSVAFVSHSGALAVAILDWSRQRGMGFSLFASLGNQADVDETDVLRAVAEDPETRVIALYLEGVADGRRFFDALAAAAPRKPVVVLKAGRSPEGARAVGSHTGALAGSDVVFEAAIRQAGAVRARTIEELFDLARALEAQPLPSGRRLLIVTNGGGLGVVATDAAREGGLRVEPLAEDVRARLRTVLPPTASVANPVDLVGDADAARFGNALHAIGIAAAADAALVLVTAQAATDAATVARAIVAGTRGLTVPVVTAFVGGPRVLPGIAVVEEAGIPCFPFPERAVGALAGMARLAELRRQRVDDAAAGGGDTPSAQNDIRPGGPPPPAAAMLRTLAAADGESKRLGLRELAPVLEACGIGVTPWRFAASPGEAGEAAERVGFPVALKLVSPDVTHKSDVGGVRLDLASPAAVRAAAAAMLVNLRAARPAARLEGFIVQRMVRGGRELLVGVVRDGQFGPVVMAGFGGVYVEVLKDTATRLAPVSAAEALRMLDELRMAPLLRGVRGEAPVDRAAVAAVINRLAQLAMEIPELMEIELNPLVAGPEGAMAVDARATVAAGASGTRERGERWQSDGR